jgi:hypothetical protein
MAAPTESTKGSVRDDGKSSSLCCGCGRLLKRWDVIDDGVSAWLIAVGVQPREQWESSGSTGR